MKALLLDVGSTFVKYAVCTDTQDAYVLQDKLPFPSPLTEEPFTVAAAARSVGKPWGIITTSSVLLEKAKALAVDMISYGSELHMLDAECKKIRKMFR